MKYVNVTGLGYYKDGGSLTKIRRLRCMRQSADGFEVCGKCQAEMLAGCGDLELRRRDWDK